MGLKRGADFSTFYSCPIKYIDLVQIEAQFTQNIN